MCPLTQVPSASAQELPRTSDSRLAGHRQGSRYRQRLPLCPSCPPGLRPLRLRSDPGFGTAGPCGRSCPDRRGAVGFGWLRDGLGPFQERLPFSGLMARFLWEYHLTVLRWARWAQAEVQAWPDDLSQLDATARHEGRRSRRSAPWGW